MLTNPVDSDVDVGKLGGLVVVASPVETEPVIPSVELAAVVAVSVMLLRIDEIMLGGAVEDVVAGGAGSEVLVGTIVSLGSDEDGTAELIIGVSVVLIITEEVLESIGVSVVLMMTEEVLESVGEGLVVESVGVGLSVRLAMSEEIRLELAVETGVEVVELGETDVPGPVIPSVELASVELVLSVEEVAVESEEMLLDVGSVPSEAVEDDDAAVVPPVPENDTPVLTESVDESVGDSSCEDDDGVIMPEGPKVILSGAATLAEEAELESELDGVCSAVGVGETMIAGSAPVEPTSPDVSTTAALELELDVLEDPTSTVVVCSTITVVTLEELAEDESPDVAAGSGVKRLEKDPVAWPANKLDSDC
jgi:hypothetical protein